jgi:hypothetical protein
MIGGRLACSKASRHESRVFQKIALVSCILFGMAMIINTQLACDGGWYWYAFLLRNGRHLYSDLHVVFQPFIVLQNEAWMSMVGKGWLISRIPAILYLVAFVSGISLLAGESGWSDQAKALLIGTAFFVGIHFEAFRFDDYHVISNICYLFMIFLLLALNKDSGSDHRRRQLAVAAALGILAGVTITNRITDGAGLFVCTILAIACLAKIRKGRLLAAFCIVALVTALSLVNLTGDSFGAYVSSTVVNAAGPKGGAAHILARPLLLFWNSLHYLIAWRSIMVILLSLLVGVSWTFLLQPFFKSDIRKSGTKALLGIVIICCSLYLLAPYFAGGRIIVDVSAVLVLAFYGLALVVAYRIVRAIVGRDHESSLSTSKESVLFLPFALLLAGSLSSGGVHFGLYDPISILLLISPVIFPATFTRDRFRSTFLAMITLMALSGAWAKVVDPVSWQSYRTFPMFSHRLLIHHPVYGPMIIDDELHHFMERTCAIVKTQPNPDLLSIPLPYANYYCAIPPWEGFVQTFFDTAGKDVIDSLMSKLDHSPPQWVLYQRQLDELLRHEVLYNNGKHLPQRDLDDFIVKKVRSGQWIVVDRAPYLGDQWVLIKTH